MPVTAARLGLPEQGDRARPENVALESKRRTEPLEHGRAVGHRQTPAVLPTGGSQGQGRARDWAILAQLPEEQRSLRKVKPPVPAAGQQGRGVWSTSFDS